MADLRDLGPGDEVAITQHLSAAQIVRVVRVTDRHIITTAYGYERKWRRDDGRPVPKPTGFFEPRLALVSDEMRDQAERARLRDRILAVMEDPRRRDRLSTDTLRTIAAALRADPATGGERG